MDIGTFHIRQDVIEYRRDHIITAKKKHANTFGIRVSKNADIFSSDGHFYSYNRAFHTATLFFDLVRTIVEYDDESLRNCTDFAYRVCKSALNSQK